MLRALVSFSLRFRGVVVALACVVIGYGIYTALHANLDVFPDFVPPQVTVQTEAPGLAPEQVESLVTQPIETAVSGLGHQESMRSSSIQGLSIITLVFKEGTDIFRARQLLAEKLNEVTGRLPIGVKRRRLQHRKTIFRSAGPDCGCCCAEPSAAASSSIRSVQQSEKGPLHEP